MVADTARRPSSADGLRPLSLARDWGQVINLIEIAFGEDLDAEAQRALHSMRPPFLLAPLIGLLNDLSPPGEGMMPGFVWVERGQVVGTASARRIYPLGHGWLISNVAVHPEWQGRGIGRTLMEACIDLAADQGAAWVALQVRENNRAALQLYNSLNFYLTGKVVRRRRPAAAPAAEGPLPVEGLRPARWSDRDALFRLARTLTPASMLWSDNMDRQLYRTGLLSRLWSRLRGPSRRWWVKAESGPHKIHTAAVGVEVDRRNPWHRLRLLLRPGAQDPALASGLIAFGLTQLSDAPPLPVEIEHPEADEATQSALAGAGFEPLYNLVHMRLNFK